MTEVAGFKVSFQPAVSGLQLRFVWNVFYPLTHVIKLGYACQCRSHAILQASFSVLDGRVLQDVEEAPPPDLVSALKFSTYSSLASDAAAKIAPGESLSNCSCNHWVYKIEK